MQAPCNLIHFIVFMSIRYVNVLEFLYFSERRYWCSHSVIWSSLRLMIGWERVWWSERSRSLIECWGKAKSGWRMKNHKMMDNDRPLRARWPHTLFEARVAIHWSHYYKYHHFLSRKRWRSPYWMMINPISLGVNGTTDQPSYWWMAMRHAVNGHSVLPRVKFSPIQWWSRLGILLQRFTYQMIVLFFTV